MHLGESLVEIVLVEYPLDQRDLHTAVVEHTVSAVVSPVSLSGCRTCGVLGFARCVRRCGALFLALRLTKGRFSTPD